EELHQLSLAEAKRLPLEQRPTDMHSLLERIVERVAPDAEAKSISLSIERLTDQVVLSVDPNRMTQVLLNLFVNAVRHTPEGGTVKAYLDHCERPQDRRSIASAPPFGSQALRITIADTGPGIAPEQLPHIF